MKLDLGCGHKPLQEGYHGVDLPSEERIPTSYTLALKKPPESRPGIFGVDLGNGFPWPFEDGSVEALRSEHLIEHLLPGTVLCYDRQGDHLLAIGQRDRLLRFMDEAWRVTRLGGQFLLRWPSLVDVQTGQICLTAFQDPTHYRWIPEAQLSYFSRAGRETLGVSHYPAICNWRATRVLQRQLGDGVTSAILVESEALLVREA